MIIDKWIRENIFAGFKRNIMASEIVIHATAGGGTLAWIKSATGERLEKYKRGIGLFHYLILRDGTVIEVLPPDVWCYHSTSLEHDADTTGIELEKLDSKNADEVTPEQMVSLAVLIKNICESNPIKTIVSHDYNAAKYSKYPPKPCPGIFPWDELKQFYSGEIKI